MCVHLYAYTQALRPEQVICLLWKGTGTPHQVKEFETKHATLHPPQDGMPETKTPKAPKKGKQRVYTLTQSSRSSLSDLTRVTGPLTLKYH